MSELKPVAYLVSQEPYSSARYIVCDKPVPIDNKQITPLYTKEQLQPRVKMTKKEVDEFKKLHKSRNHLIPIHFLKFLLDNGDSYPLLHSRYWDGREEQLVLLTLWLRFDPKHPEETIEIIPEKKWFVRSKKRDGNERFSYIKSILSTQVVYGFSLSEELSEKEDYPYQFDTKEQAEEWTNPLTEAVLLPVGDE